MNALNGLERNILALMTSWMLDNESMKMIENVGQKRASMILQQQERIVISYYVTISTQNGLHAYSHKGFDYIKKPLFKH